MKSFICFFLLAFAIKANAQLDAASVSQLTLDLSPRNYFIAEVTDSRKIKDGSIHAIKDLLKRSVNKNDALIPIRIRLLDLKLNSVKTARGEQGICQMQIGFESLVNATAVELGEQAITAQHTSQNVGQAQAGAMRASLKKSLEDFDVWMDKNKDSPAFNKGIKVKLTRKLKARPNSDTIYYSPDYKLQWKDFVGTPENNNPAAAATFSGIGYDAETTMEDGYFTIHLDVSIYFLRSQSWVKATATNAYTLDHEQLHYDITALAAFEFIRDVNNARIDMDNYNITVLSLFQKANKRSLDLQDAYDRETNHSLNKDAQARWVKQIRDELKAFQ